MYGSLQDRYRIVTGAIQWLFLTVTMKLLMSKFETIRFVRVVLSGRYHHFEVKLHIVTDIKVK